MRADPLTPRALPHVLPGVLPLARFAHPGRVIDAAPALASTRLWDTLSNSARVAPLVERLLERRLLAGAGGEPQGFEPPALQPGAAAFFVVPAARRDARWTERLLLLGAVSFGPLLRGAILRDEVLVAREALGEPVLRAALAHAALGSDTSGLDFLDAAATRAAVRERAAEHLAAWLRRQPASVAERLALALPPDWDLDLGPGPATHGAPELLDALEPALKTLDRLAGREGDAA